MLGTFRKFASTLDRRNNFLPLHLFSPYYDRRDKRPGVIALAFSPLSRQLARVRERGAISRRWVSARLPVQDSNVTGLDLPSIELLVVSAEKDFGTLSNCIRQAHITSKNPVVKTTLIVPSDSLQRAKELSMSWNLLVEVLSEDSFVSPDLAKRLKKTFGDRYGWILQQYLTVRFVSESRSEGVLVVDADTILLRPQTWLTKEGQQILSVSSEYESRYYYFLSSLGISSQNPRHTFVTHHMLMQPNFMKKALESAGFSEPDQLAKEVCDFAVRESQNVFCIEFELYAQWLVEHRRERAVLTKFSNRTVSMDREPISDLTLARLINKASKKFVSISLHEYAQSGTEEQSPD